MRRALTVLGLALLLGSAGCASVGKDFDESKVGNIKNGQTTRAEIEAWFGPPAERSTAGTGGPRYTYKYAHSSWGGASTKSKALVVDFNAKDVVVDHAYSSQ